MHWFIFLFLPFRVLTCAQVYFDRHLHFFLPRTAGKDGKTDDVYDESRLRVTTSSLGSEL